MIHQAVRLGALACVVMRCLGWIEGGLVPPDPRTVRMVNTTIPAANVTLRLPDKFSCRHQGQEKLFGV